MSSCGLRFTADKALPVGLGIQAAIEWPARLNGRIHLQLILSGVVVRSDGTTTALEIQSYEFKTRRAIQET
jgi:hypothetical protein